MSCLAVILKVHIEVLRSAEQTVPSQQGQQSFKLFDMEIDGDVHLDEPQKPMQDNHRYRNLDLGIQFRGRSPQRMHSVDHIKTGISFHF